MKNTAKHTSVANNLNQHLAPILSNDAYRLLLNCIHVKNGFLYASNGHICLKQSLTLHDLEDDDIEALEGKHIHRTILALLYKHKHVKFTQDCIKAYMQETQAWITYPYFKTEDKPIDFDNVIDNALKMEAAKDLNKFGFNPELTVLLFKALRASGYGTGVAMELKKANQAFIVHTNNIDLQVAIQMPVMMSSNYY